MSTMRQGYPMPLFERLVEDSDAWLEGEGALRDSVARELSRLLNARSRLTMDEFARSDCGVLDYGVPDFSERSLRSGADCDAILAAVRHAIALFEPRLVNVNVKFAFRGDNSRDAVLVVEGDIRVERSVDHVFFELAAGAGASRDDPDDC
ncbi:type VI secretion system baseplate subunit TssE [Trinickia sp. Y13]|uniref:type VI secretion system baseplate subunit TssE n=1 Tax=Trinickia sp. Y13 TaxID=2917807 RepID=UPI0024053C8E|nr:type VI secretion system baseplate subunit TssE [Trinickia sp. Y13]MDG0024619.1 type VI secretion system baseplate subunit TssE [Trinickia sp. Y13]